MKFIHLSDLHIGKRVNEVSMLEDQQYILSSVIRIVDEEKPEAVLIAGDVFDKSIPPAEAVTLFDDFLYRLSKRNAAIFIISGNHDSAERLAFGGRLMNRAGIYVSPVYDGNIDPIELQVIERIAKAMSIQNADFQSILALYQRQKDINWAYTALEISPSSSNDEVKKAYRRMAMKYHPDKVANAGEDIRQQATEKFRGINEAYEHIKQQRGL